MDLQELIEYKKARYEEHKKQPRISFRPDLEGAMRLGEITGLLIAKTLLENGAYQRMEGKE